MASVANLDNLIVRSLREGSRGECHTHLRGWGGRNGCLPVEGVNGDVPSLLGCWTSGGRLCTLV